MFKIALTGGPCSGKSTVLALLKTFPQGKEYRVGYLTEVASELLKERPHYIKDHDDIVLRQFYIYRTQIAMENCLCEELERETQRKTVLITDRGLSDALAYLEEGDIEKVTLGGEAEAFADRYDAVLFFEPTDETQYQNKNNKARFEDSYEQILRTSEKTKQAWIRYYSGKMEFVGAAASVEEKAKSVARQINRLAGGTVFEL
ncbi:MAG: hypothetical protein E7655_08645 [Ruminococcaceae bacterium]|nr:hypothetical protein [Oscillospiraceae bacterium]